MSFDPKQCDPKQITAASPLRVRLAEETKTALKARQTERLGTLRLISAKIKDQDILIREKGRCAVDDAHILGTLQSMIKQRRESIEMFENGGKQEAADKEKAEITVIEEFLPQQITGAALEHVVVDAIKQSGANDVKDMGKVMGILKQQYSGQLNFADANVIIKEKLAG